MPDPAYSSTISEHPVTLRCRDCGRTHGLPWADSERTSVDIRGATGWEIDSSGAHCPCCVAIGTHPYCDLAIGLARAAQAVSDSNFRRLEADLRKHGWLAQADQVQAFRKVLEDYNQLLPQELPDA